MKKLHEKTYKEINVNIEDYYIGDLPPPSNKPSAKPKGETNNLKYGGLYYKNITNILKGQINEENIINFVKKENNWFVGKTSKWIDMVKKIDLIGNNLQKTKKIYIQCKSKSAFYNKIYEAKFNTDNQIAIRFINNHQPKNMENNYTKHFYWYYVCNAKVYSLIIDLNTGKFSKC